MWHNLGNKDTIAYEKWPEVNEEFAKDDEKTIVVMVNGKLRGKFQASTGTPDEKLKEKALENQDAKRFLDRKQIVKCVIVKDKLVNFVVK